ncbi:restriction endonuclease subunit S [Myroides sp. ZB35]|uniref:restriction endonuclease subunit S n=1 Tax=Myroides sp. ZB35 TaxID=1458492 RepID=UPI0009F5BFCD|nr:restriction endonuclease subunit S [Myroides sp. ZB35]
MRFPGFEGEWETKKLEEIADKVNSGKTPLGGEDVYTKKGVLFIRSQNVNNDRLELNNSVFIPESVNNQMKNSIVRSNDILLNITGASLGRSCVVPEDFKIGNVNQHVCIIRLKQNYNSRFIQPIFSSYKGQNIFNSLQTGSGREGLNFESIKGIKLSIPQKNEQQKIADFLSLIDERITTQNKIIEELEQLIKGLCINLILKQVPNAKLNQCVICNTSSLTESEVINQQGTHPVYGATGIITYTVDYQIDKDAILIIKDGSGVGKVQYATNKFSVIGTLNYLTIKSQVNLRYILYSLKFFNFEKYKVGSGIPHIYFKDYGEALIYCPSLAEQYKIEGLLSSIDKKIEIEKQNLNQLNLQKQFLLKELFI